MYMMAGVFDCISELFRQLKSFGVISITSSRGALALFSNNDGLRSPPYFGVRGQI